MEVASIFTLPMELLGLAFMTKGPVALLFFIPPVLLFGILQKDRRILKASDRRPWLVAVRADRFALVPVCHACDCRGCPCLL